MVTMSTQSVGVYIVCVITTERRRGKTIKGDGDSNHRKGREREMMKNGSVEVIIM